MQEITVSELKEKMDSGEDVQLIDVRQPNEFAFAKIEGAKLIPLGEVMQRVNELDPSKEIIFSCKAGGRSAHAIQMLEAMGFQADMKNLRGGIIAWSNEIDPSIPKY